jgi:BirA family biotin operon repressor/biotin-[acetyl-CoA-carboxylase] ligase
VASGQDIWSSTEWPVGWTVRHVAETGSTNADLLAAYRRGEAGHRAVLATDHQTAGRGRLGRRWVAPRGSNLLVSMLFERVPTVPAELTHRVGLAAVDAARRLLGPSAPAIGLKWPNDLLLEERKLAGILAERDRSGVVVVGMGLNVGWAPDGAARLGDDLSPAQVLASTLAAYDRLPPSVGDRYRDELLTLGRPIRIELPSGQAVLGRATDVDEQGRLVVVDDDGVTHHFDVGDVVHARTR